MKQLVGGLFMFLLGVVVGTAGSDDSLIADARQKESMAFGRGHEAATAKLQAIAVQRGHARWALDPLTGTPTLFVWKQPDDLDSPAAELTSNGFQAPTTTAWNGH